MSLQAWLPLNGNLNNQGLANIIATNNGATINNSGKLGQCYSFDGNDDYIELNGSILNSLFSGGSQNFSMAFWIYHADATRAIIFGDHNLSGAISFNIELTTEHKVRFYWGGSPDKNFNVTVAASGWTHITLIYDGSKILIYKDGILQSDSYSGILGAKNKTSGQFYLGRDSRTGSTTLNGRLNDFRLYDHALSPKEVEEISKGLVVHFKLDDPYGEKTTNLWQIADYSSSSHTLKPYIADNTTSYINHNISTNIDSYGANKVTISMDITNNTDTNIYFRARTQDTSNTWLSFVAAQSTAYASPGKTTRVYQTFDWDTGTNGTSIYLRYYLGKQRGQYTSTDNFIISHIQVEAKDHPTPWVKEATTRNSITIYDTSGYGNNGIINGNLIVTTSSPRYNTATTFPTASDYFYFPHLVDSTAMNNEFTFSCWLYRDYTDATARYFYYGLCQIYLHTDFKPRITWRLASADLSYNSDNTWAAGAPAIAAQTWTHLVFTFKNGILYCYVNGVQYGPSDRSSNGQFIRGTQGSPNASLGYSWIGKLSDVRTYATALSAAAIKELYDTSAAVDSSGNAYARELVEL